MDEWINKLWYLHSVEYYLAIKKNDMFDTCYMWINLPNTMLSE